MAKISVVIPARNEPYLQQTIDSLLTNAQGEVEVIVVLDGYWPDPPLKDDPRVKLIHKGRAEGMRPALNSAVAMATGEYILKSDAHCMFAPGYDLALLADMEDRWIVVPRRYRLDAENWKIIEDGRPPVDYMYLDKKGLNGRIWDRPDAHDEIDDLMTAQGSCYFIKRDYWYELELLDAEKYGNFWNELQEIGLKCWLGPDGAVKVNKKTWYAHWHKPSRGYSMGPSQKTIAAEQVEKWHTFGEAWGKQEFSLEWLIKKFAPVPTWD